jgi:hypothetical protein
MLTILRAVLMYRPMKVFTVISSFFILIGGGVSVRFLYYYFNGNGSGHVQSLILATMLIIIGFQTLVTGLQADVISANRKIMEDMQFRIKKLEFGLLDAEGHKRKDE